MQLQSNVNGEKAQLIDIIQRLVTGVIDVLDKLMSDYLIGNLYLAFHHQEQFKHGLLSPCPLCAEQTLGLAVYHSIRKVHITKVGFIDGKVKCKKQYFITA